MRLAEEIQIVPAFVPVDMSDGANAGDWVSLKNFNHIACVLLKAAGTAGDDPVFTVEQAQSAGGLNHKALKFSHVYKKQGTLAEIGQFTRIAQVAANTYVDLASAEEEAVFVVEFDAEELDAENGFGFVQLTIPDVGSNEQLGCGFYLLSEPRYSPPLSAIDS